MHKNHKKVVQSVAQHFLQFNTFYLSSYLFFLDEGFGSLDDEALDTALSTISGLRQEGKLIGVISHVAALKERIHTQIIIKKGNNGQSRIIIPG